MLWLIVMCNVQKWLSKDTCLKSGSIPVVEVSIGWVRFSADHAGSDAETRRTLQRERITFKQLEYMLQLTKKIWIPGKSRTHIIETDMFTLKMFSVQKGKFGILLVPVRI